MAVDLGRIGFEAYAASTANKTHDGKEIPKWENVGKQVQDAWRAAAVAIIQQLNREKEYDDLNDGNE